MQPGLWPKTTTCSSVKIKVTLGRITQCTVQDWAQGYTDKTMEDNVQLKPAILQLKPAIQQLDFIWSLSLALSEVKGEKLTPKGEKESPKGILT